MSNILVLFYPCEDILEPGSRKRLCCVDFVGGGALRNVHCCHHLVRLWLDLG